MADEKAGNDATTRQRHRRLAQQRLPEILNTLACGTIDEQKDLLTALCPCRNRRYDRHVWEAIFNAAAESASGTVRDQAGHAIETLRERARTDPRTQDLLRRLVEAGISAPITPEAIPEWIPDLRGGGLYVPRFVPPARSKANRRR